MSTIEDTTRTEGPTSAPVAQALIRMLRFAVIALAVLGAPPLAAQRPTYVVRGVVTDTDLAPVAGVEVLIPGRSRGATTYERGWFVLDSVPEGRIRLTVRRVGYMALHPTIAVPQPPLDSLHIILIPFAQQLAPLEVEIPRRVISGVVGDTGYRALPGTTVELVGGGTETLTDSTGRFVFDDLKKGHYMLRVARPGYQTRVIGVDLTGTGREFSIFLQHLRPGRVEWADSRQAIWALDGLALRLSMEPRRNRMTRDELARYGSMALCDIPRIRALVRDQASVIMRGTDVLFADLCAWSADQMDLIEWGGNSCRSVGGVARTLGNDCRPQGALTTRRQSGFVILWPRA
jgi:hypothetical protein